MGYIYLTDEEAAERWDATVESYQDIDIPESISASDLVALINSVDGRLSVNITGIVCRTYYTNYYRTAGGNLRMDVETGSLSILPMFMKDTVITGP